MGAPNHHHHTHTHTYAHGHVRQQQHTRPGSRIPLTVKADSDTQTDTHARFGAPPHAARPPHKPHTHTHLSPTSRSPRSSGRVLLLVVNMISATHGRPDADKAAARPGRSKRCVEARGAMPPAARGTRTSLVEEELRRGRRRRRRRQRRPPRRCARERERLVCARHLGGAPMSKARGGWHGSVRRAHVVRPLARVLQRRHRAVRERGGRRGARVEEKAARTARLLHPIWRLNG